MTDLRKCPHLHLVKVEHDTHYKSEWNRQDYECLLCGVTIICRETAEPGDGIFQPVMVATYSLLDDCPACRDGSVEVPLVVNERLELVKA